jgi:hypothetical protein
VLLRDYKLMVSSVYVRTEQFSVHGSAIMYDIISNSNIVAGRAFDVWLTQAPLLYGPKILCCGRLSKHTQNVYLRESLYTVK